ncbi:MAG: peroxidase-related enzyme [Pseudomonadota bacterium]
MDGEEPVISLDLPAGPLSDETQAYFAKCEEKLGLVPNVLRAYAFDETKLRAFTQMYNELMLGDSGLSKLERELVAVVVSAANRCHYCVIAHGAALRALCGDADLVDTLVVNWRVAKLEPRHRAMAAYAAALTDAPDAAGPHLYEGLRAVGLSDRDIWDLTAVVGFFNMSNRVASATRMAPNEEYYAAARKT